MLGLHGTEQTSPSDGASFNWHDFCSFLDSLSPDRVVRNTAQPLPAWLGQSGQYFFEHHQKKRVLEILCLKLSLLRDACGVVVEDHEHRSRARGVIGPEQIIIRIPERRLSAVPIRWSAQACLVETSKDESVTVESMPEEMASRVSVHTLDEGTVYAASCFRSWPPGKAVIATALVQAADLIPDDDQANVRGLIRVHLIADGLQARDFSDIDVFRVTLPDTSVRGTSVKLWARKVEAPERGIIVSGMTDTMPITSWTAFSQGVSAVRAESAVAVYRAGSPADDLYSCGMLLLRALVGSEELRWRRVCECMPTIVAGLEPVVQGLAMDDHYTVFARVRDRLRESGDSFDSPTVPNFLWWDVMVVVLRACSRIRGFSYATEAEPFTPSPVRAFMQDLSSLVRRICVELFESDERDAAIRQACDQVRGRFGGGAW